jgi:riboflavin kinase
MKQAPPTSQQLSSLVTLSRLNAGAGYVEISSSRLGEALGLSQQAASKRLLDLEEVGLIERVHSGRGLKVRLTEPGLQAIRSLYVDLKGALEPERKEVTFRGAVFTGLQEGRYYISLRGYAKQFRETLGFEPFPGTLNLRLTDPAMTEQRRRLKLLPGVDVQGFKDGKRSYGPVKCFRAMVSGKYPGAVLAIERTHYDSSVLEVISPLNLRRTLSLKDGDKCAVTAYLE